MTPTFVQGANNQQGAGATQMQAYGSNVTINNVLLVQWAGQGFATLPTPTIADTQGNAWTVITSIVAGGGLLFSWFAIAKATGATTVTITFGHNITSESALAVQEYSGSAGVDLSNPQSGFFAAPSTLSLTTTTPNQTAVEAAFSAFQTPAVAAPFMSRTLFGGDGDIGDIAEAVSGTLVTTSFTNLTGGPLVTLFALLPPKSTANALYFAAD